MPNQQLRNEFDEFVTNLSPEEVRNEIGKHAEDLFSEDELTHCNAHANISEAVSNAGLQMTYQDQEAISQFLDEIEEARYE